MDSDGICDTYYNFASGNIDHLPLAEVVGQEFTPPTGIVTINDGAAYTTSLSVILTLSCSDANGCSQMQFSNDGTSYTDPEAYATTKSWAMTGGDGTKTVYVKYKDGADNWMTTPATDTIVLDTTPSAVTIIQPENITYYYNEGLSLNFTLSETGDWCGYSLDGEPNVTIPSCENTTFNVSSDGAHNLTVYTNDTAGNTNSLTVWFTISKYNISLDSGWNLISIPLEQNNWSITSVLASIDGKYNVVFEYKDGGWKRSTAPRSPLTDMSLEYGYWINMTEPATLELSGTVPPITTININPVWNLVGYPSLTAQNVTIVLSTINYSVVFEYRNGGWKRYPAPRSPLTEMSPGYGYWIKANEAGSYEVPAAQNSSEASASGPNSSPPAMPTLLDLNLLDNMQMGSNIDTSRLLTIDYLGSDSNQQSINSVDNANVIFWGIYDGKSNLYAEVPAKDGTDIIITVDGYESLTVTADEGGYVSGDYNLHHQQHGGR